MLVRAYVATAEAVPSFRSIFLANRRHLYRKQQRSSPALDLAFAHGRRYAWTCSAGCIRFRPGLTNSSTTTTHYHHSHHSYTGHHLRSSDCRADYYSTHANQTPVCEQVTVACKSNGEITLSIFHPAVQPHDDPVSPVILYLPTGPHALDTWSVSDEKIIAALSAASNATIVRVNYRLGYDGVQYPTPIHDVLAGYDYVRHRFSTPASSSTSRSGRTRKTHLRVGVCGQLVGGSLAAMLALTESRIGEDRCAAAALNSPITDWIFPERSPQKANSAEHDQTDEALERTLQRRRKKKQQLTSWEAYSDADGLTTTSLEAMRDALFKKPANYFDPFASPVLFLRSAGVIVPSDATVEEEEGAIIDELIQSRSKPRKVHRNFPPSNSSLTLPHVRLSLGEANPLFDQDEEFVKLLRRSVVRSAQNRATTQALLDRFDEAPATEMERLERAVAAAEERIEYHVHSGTGLWGTPNEHEWLDEVWQVARWFREILT